MIEGLHRDVDEARAPPAEQEILHILQTYDASHFALGKIPVRATNACDARSFDCCHRDRIKAIIHCWVSKHTRCLLDHLVNTASEENVFSGNCGEDLSSAHGVTHHSYPLISSLVNEVDCSFQIKIAHLVPREVPELRIRCCVLFVLQTLGGAA